MAEREVRTELDAALELGERFILNAPEPERAAHRPVRGRIAIVGAQTLTGGFEEGTNRFRYGSGEQAWTLWLNHYGPAKSLASNLDDARREEFKRDMIAWHETFRSELGYDQPRQYLITSRIRR
jgi:hypothetical protein